jgi:tetratricopeptide (TPR) repeat protein
MLAVGIFLFTRAMAGKERELDTRVGATWFRAGQQQLQAGDLERTIASFRKATASDRENRTYSLALANALARAGHNPEARQILLNLREATPEDAEINLQLARLAAKRGDIEEAVRYYRNALYGLWTGTRIDEQRRDVRLELIQFLLDHNQRNQALSELLILGTEIPPDDATAQIQIAQLFLKSGDPTRALAHYKRAIDLERNNPGALAGAGEAAFQLGDYARSERYFQAAVARGDNQDSTLSVFTLAKAIVSHDPLTPFLSQQERRRRMLGNFDHALERLQSCLSEPRSNSKVSPDSALDGLKAEALAMRPKLRRDARVDSELLRAGLGLIYQIEEATGKDCGKAEALDQALLLIGQKHTEAAR